MERGVADGGGGGRVSVRYLHCVTLTPIHGFRSFSQTVARQTLSMNEAERDIADHRNNLTRFMIHGKLTASEEELAAKKAASNRGWGRESGPGHPPKKVGLAKSRLLGRLAVREAAREDYNIIGDLAYH